MGKPLWRWTCGPCLQQGLDILAESIDRTTEAYGINNWDWVICHNGLNNENVTFLRSVIGTRPIQLYSQDWSLCAVDDNCQNPRRRDGSFEWNGNRCGGTMWKVTPARMRMESHEIIMDNDIILLRKFPQVEEWLAQTVKVLVLEEPIRFYGRYDLIHAPGPPFFNSGFIGLPPKYDYADELSKNWSRHGRYMNLSQSDEQGLLTYTLMQRPNIRVQAEQMVEVLGRNFSATITGDEQGLHFTQANRMPQHISWKRYLELRRNEVI